MSVEATKNELVIRLPLEKIPRPSKSGNTLIVAGTGGFIPTTVQVNGKPVRVSVNAIITP